MQKELNEILNKFTPEDIETALVQLFVHSNKIPVEKNSLVKSILNRENEQISIIKKLLMESIETRILTDFVNFFELLIPASDKKINGSFFTPRFITDFIVNETIKDSEQKICDPSCGCGAFLITAAEFLSKRFNKNVLKVIEENIYGVDIADYSIRRAKILLSLLALQNGEDEKDIKFNITATDSLAANWQKLFPEEMRAGGFDIVIGNPPYVKFQDLNKELRSNLYNDWCTLKTGNYNLYFAFFELGIKIMKEDGILGYITPNNYFTSLAGIQLREYLALNKLVQKIIDFNHLKLFEAQTYTAITFLKKWKSPFFYYERADTYKTLNSLDKLNYSKVFFKDLNKEKWRILREIDQENIKKIENIGWKLGDVVDIRVGIATCKDSVYFIDGTTLKNGFYLKKYRGKDYPIEKDITKPIVKISDFKNQDDLSKNSRRMIFPYQKINGRAEIIKETELKRLYPYCYSYFLSARAELATRDKGNVEYPEWYAYARTQGLTFFGKKLLTPTFSAEPRFLLEEDEDSLFCNGYAIYLIDRLDLFLEQNKRLELDTLAKILNSCVMGYYIKQTSVAIEGDYPCYQKNFIELFGIPELTAHELNFLKEEKDKEKIDNFLVEKYKINICVQPLSDNSAPKPVNVYVE
jgi:type I restriction-modification system DNA methylase subunit